MVTRAMCFNGEPARGRSSELDLNMASVVPEPGKIKTFRTEAAFESWMRRNHARQPEVWVRIYKKGSGVQSITITEALDVVLCWGWIDGLRKAFDERSYLQRYTPRRPKSMWSQINRKHVARLTKTGRLLKILNASTQSCGRSGCAPLARPRARHQGRAFRGHSPAARSCGRPSPISGKEPDRRSRTRGRGGSAFRFMTATPPWAFDPAPLRERGQQQGQLQ